MGMGGSIVASAHGYDSFFSNPAGYSRDQGSFTLLDATTWIYSRPDELAALAAQSIAGTASSDAFPTFVIDQVTKGGFGIGASMGIGYVGNGLGLGMVIIEDSMLYGQTLGGARGDLIATVGFIGGLSVPLDVLGFKIHIGGDIRPMIRIHVPIDSSNAFDMVTALQKGEDAFAALSSADALYGAGIALDLGAIAELGWFTVGLSVRDLGGTQFKYDTNSFGTVSSTLGSQLRFPAGSTVTADQYVIPMDIAFGIGMHPTMGSFNRFVDPTIDVDLHDLVGVFGGTRPVWTALHAGAELKLISLFALRAGLNQGYFTMGAGLKLFFLDLNFAIYTQELGAHIGDRPSSGASLNMAIRW
jgi:hypothetical protein